MENKNRKTGFLLKCRMIFVLGFLFILSTGFSSTLDSQESPSSQEAKKTVTGVIQDATGETIIGATVIEKGNPTNGVSTDVDGKFSLKVANDATIIVSYIGYKTKAVNTAGKSTLSIVIEEDAQLLGEVVIVGYGTQKKENLTGAVSQVKMDNVLGDRPITNIGGALQGAIAGLTVTPSQIPGSGSSFNIRGTTSINGGSPLVLVDGVESHFNLVNPEDIESVTVLKDAASSAIYGARGAFGVILINTKKAGKNSELTISYNNSFAFSKSINRPIQASVADILATHIDFDNDGKYFENSQDFETWLSYVEVFNESPDKLLEMYPGSYLDAANGAFIPKGESVYYFLQDNDPNGELLDLGFKMTHNVSATGGGEKISYRLSFGSTSNDGPLITDKDSYERINVQSYVSADVTDWLTTEMTVSFARSESTDLQNKDGGLSAYIYSTKTSSFNPIHPFLNSNDLEGEKKIPGSPANHVRESNPKYRQASNPRIFSRTTFKPIQGLDAVLEYAYDQRNSDYKHYSNNWQYLSTDMGIGNASPTPTYNNTKGETRYNSLNAFATYTKASNDLNHNFKVMAGFAQENKYFEQLNISRKDMINPDMPSINGGTGEILSDDKYTDFSIRSGYFRLNYNYKNKYLVEANGRYDGSSRFPKSNRFGFFPSASAGWQVGRESFMSWSENWLDQFKVRASWGQIGNQSIDNYLYNPSMGTSLADWIVGDAKPSTLGMPAMVRSDFTWETVQSLDIGFDFSAFNNRLTTTFSWYQRDTKGMLSPGMELPGVVGADAAFQNTADLRTKGWEVAIGWQDNINDWSYGVNFNIYDSRSHITKYGSNEAGLLTVKIKGEDKPGQYVGREMNEIWGYVSDGYYSIDDFVNSSAGGKGWEDNVWALKEGVTSIRGNKNIRPGDVKFQNLRDDEESVNEIYAGEGTLSNPGDQKIIGNSTPRYRFGLTTNVGWKGLNVSMLFNGTAKRDAWLSGQLIWPMGGGTFGTVYSHQLDYWKPMDAENGDWRPQNSDAEFPRIYGEANASGSNQRKQTQYLANAAYLRLKNLTVSYTIPTNLVSKVGLRNAKVFFSGENLLTFDHLPDGYDPERLNWGYPFYATYSFGLNITL